MTCRDGHEELHNGVRAGARLTEATLDALTRRKGRPGLRVRGVKCISQCKRSCTIALSGAGRFTYVFGDLDPHKPDHVDAVLTVSSLYRDAP